MPGPRFEGLRITLSVQPSNAESPTPMYFIAHHLDGYNNISRGVPVALALTDSLGGCEVLKASNPKRSENAFCMYVSRPPVITQSSLLTDGHLPQGLSAFRKDVAKLRK